MEREKTCTASESNTLNMDKAVAEPTSTGVTLRQEELAMYAKALGHPVRLFVLEFLSRRACCYSGDLSQLLPIAKSTLSQHLKELKKAKLIQGTIETPKIKYCLNRERWEAARNMFCHLFSCDQKNNLNPKK